VTLTERAAAYARAFPNWPASWPRVGQEQGRDVLYAIWLIGNDYRNKTTFYGAYPKSYLPRVMALFPDAAAEHTLHVFSGSLPAGPYLRCDVKEDAEYPCSVYDLPQRVLPLFDLVLADPPYSAVDAQRYGTPMVNRGKALRALAAITRPGGHCVWLDCTWPMHSKEQWLTVGRIPIIRSTNHRVRLCTIFERMA
jgi:hypothetical protein